MFYRQGLFGDAIILDQAWALEAIYAVFDRDSKAFRNIERYGGRFRRSDLAQWVWQKHGKEERQLFPDLMQQCGICFVIREGDDAGASNRSMSLLICFPSGATPKSRAHSRKDGIW